MKNKKPIRQNMVKILRDVEFKRKWRRFDALLDVVAMELENFSPVAETASYLAPPVKNITNRQKRIVIHVANPSPPIPYMLMEGITRVGSDEANPVWLAEKKLTVSDINPSLSRFFMPRNETLISFLNHEEMSLLSAKKTLDVKVVDPLGRDWDLSFKFWESLKQFVLIKKWNEMSKANDFQATDVVQIWAFRKKERLCFAFNMVHEGRDVRKDGASTSNHFQV